MLVNVEPSVKGGIFMSLIAEDEQERRTLERLNSSLREGFRLEIHHHVEDPDGVAQMSLESRKIRS